MKNSQRQNVWIERRDFSSYCNHLHVSFQFVPFLMHLQTDTTHSAIMSVSVMQMRTHIMGKQGSHHDNAEVTLVHM